MKTLTGSNKETFLTRSNNVLEVFKGLRNGEISSIKNRIKFDKKSQTASILGQNKTKSFRRLIADASKAYNLSDNMKDYVLVPVPTIITEVPNKNGIAFSKEVLQEFSTEAGMQRYKTWIGKPTFLEHVNQDPTKAKGVILDSVMNPLRNYPGFYKVVKLLSFDRTKDPILYNRIVSKEINSYSMGCWVESYVCSLCGTKRKSGAHFASCSHIDISKPNFYKNNNSNLVFEKVDGIIGFETSCVQVPAYRPALSDFPYIMNKENTMKGKDND